MRQRFDRSARALAAALPLIAAAAATGACGRWAGTAPGQEVVHTTAPHTEAGAQVAVIGYLMQTMRGNEELVPCAGMRHDRDHVDFAGAELEALLALNAATESASECRLSTPEGRMIHVPTGRPAVRFQTHSVRPDGSDRYLIIGGYSRASMNAASCQYVARRTSRGWNVHRDSTAPCMVA